MKIKILITVATLILPIITTGCSTLSVCVEEVKCANFTTVARDYTGIIATYDGKTFNIAVGEAVTNPEAIKLLNKLPGGF
jgi:hypothetical protein